MKRHLTQRGFTLIEVVTSTLVIGIGLAAAISISSTLMIQQELSWRTSVALNHQENAARLWQLGFNNAARAGYPAEPTISDLLPFNPSLNEAVVGTAATAVTTSNTTAYTDPLVGNLEHATNSTTVKNFTSAGNNGSTTTTDLYRPTLR